jgi:hypothetical protein
MNPPDRPGKNKRTQNILNVTLAVAAGQVGCATLVIILAAVFGGLWLDARFASKPTFTITLLLASIPVSVIVMLFLARAAISRIKAANERPKPTIREE